MGAVCSICNICNRKDQQASSTCTEGQESPQESHKQEQQTNEHDSDNQLLPPFIKRLNQTCPTHMEKYLYLCREHDQLICDTCLQTKHEKCGSTRKLGDILETFGSYCVFTDMTSELERTADILQNGIKELQDNLNRIQNQRKTMVRKMPDIDDIVKITEAYILRTMEEIKTKEKDLREIIDQKQSILQHATGHQISISIMEMKTMIEEATSSLPTLIQTLASDIANIGLGKIQITFPDPERVFGMVQVTRKLIYMSLETGKTDEAKSMTYALPQQLQLQQDVDMKSDCCGCCTLPSGMVVVFGNYSGQLKLINHDGKFKSTINIEDSPVGVTAVSDISETHVAVSHCTTISFMNVRTGVLCKRWNTNNELGGISYRKGEIFFCSDRIGVQCLDMLTSDIRNVIDDNDVDTDSCVSIGSDRICYTCPRLHTVTFLNLIHDVIFKYKDENKLEYPRGLTVDSYNNVYVTGQRSHNILVISNDGHKVQQLLSKADGLDIPTGIHYDSHARQLTVITSRHGTLRKYSLVG